MSRHRWSPPIRSLYRTERLCLKCGVLKVTHHDDPHSFPVTTWWLGKSQLYPSSGSPICRKAEARAA
jgi:hypothetical protein